MKSMKDCREQWEDWTEQEGTWFPSSCSNRKILTLPVSHCGPSSAIGDQPVVFLAGPHFNRVRLCPRPSLTSCPGKWGRITLTPRTHWFCRDPSPSLSPVLLPCYRPCPWPTSLSVEKILKFEPCTASLLFLFPCQQFSILTRDALWDGKMSSSTECSAHCFTHKGLKHFCHRHHHRLELRTVLWSALLNNLNS